MKLYYVPFLVLPIMLGGCAINGANDAQSFGGYGEMTEENLSGATYNNDAYLMAAAPKYYIGDPYKINDIQYTPAENMAYNETGVAGIVPADLTGTTTTNGEVWNGEQLLGTSKVLPLPSIVRVTNLDNGNNVVVRVNNRGPFVNTRIMDVSAAAAKKLGITNQTKVQVQILSSESESVKSETLKSATTTDVPAGAPVVLAGGNGPYMVQVAALASEDNANMLAQRIANMGNVQVQLENGLYKVRILGLDAAGAKSAIENIKNTEGTTPGLLKDGIWVNSDSI